MKRWQKILVGAVAVAVVVLMLLAVFAGTLVKNTVNVAGPRLLGVPVSVKAVQVSLLTGRFGVTDLVVGNPEGYRTPACIRLGTLDVGIRMRTLLSKVMIIERVYVKAPEITYETGLKGSNIGAIQESLGSGETDVAPSKPSDEGQKVQINDLLIEDGEIRISLVGMQGSAMPVALPTIHMTDIGKESGGASLKDVLGKIFGAISGTVTSAAKGLGHGAEILGKGTVKTGKAVGEGAVTAGKAVGEGAASAGKAVTEGAGKAVESVGNLFKKDEE
jgi:uncharacterized protein involved in outer membrane biogenesis